MTVFFYARLWRRSGVLTDLEFYEIRYSGKAATFAARIPRHLPRPVLQLRDHGDGEPRRRQDRQHRARLADGAHAARLRRHDDLLRVGVAGCGACWSPTRSSSCITMTGTFAVAYFALQQPEVGGLVRPAREGAARARSTCCPTSATGAPRSPCSSSRSPSSGGRCGIPGAEPGGGSYIAQRMLASKTEKDAVVGTLLFNVMHYALRPWPWIIVALASTIIYPQLSDISAAFPYVDPSLLGHDIAYPAMMRFLPAGFLGLVVAGTLAAYRSTIETHLNWGTSLPRPRLLSPLPAPGAEREALRARRPPHHGAADGRRRADDLRARHGEGSVRSHPLDRRGHGTALPAALVLVARQRVERDRRHGELVRRRARLLHRAQERARARRRTSRCSSPSA